MHPYPHPPEDDPRGDLNALERRIGRWSPAAGSLDRDRLMFEAGRASALGGWRRRIEHALTATLALVALGLGGRLLHERGGVAPHTPTVAVQAPAAPGGDASRVRRQAAAPAAPLEADSYLVLTRHLLAGVPENASPAGPVDRRVGPREVPEPTLSPLQLRRTGELLDL